MVAYHQFEPDVYQADPGRYCKASICIFIFQQKKHFVLLLIAKTFDEIPKSEEILLHALPKFQSHPKAGIPSLLTIKVLSRSYTHTYTLTYSEVLLSYHTNLPKCKFMDAATFV